MGKPIRGSYELRAGFRTRQGKFPLFPGQLLYVNQHGWVRRRMDI